MSDSITSGVGSWEFRYEIAYAPVNGQESKPLTLVYRNISPPSSEVWHAAAVEDQSRAAGVTINPNHIDEKTIATLETTTKITKRIFVNDKLFREMDCPREMPMPKPE